MGKYYNGPTAKELRNIENKEEFIKKYLCNLITQRVQYVALNKNLSKSIGFSTIEAFDLKEFDWFIKELEEAGFKVTIEDTRIGDDNIPKSYYCVNWD